MYFLFFIYSLSLLAFKDLSLSAEAVGTVEATLALRRQQGPNGFSKLSSFAWSPSQSQLLWKGTTDRCFMIINSRFMTLPTYLYIYVWRQPNKRHAECQQSMQFVRDLKTASAVNEVPVDAAGSEQKNPCFSLIVSLDAT